ncbi:hypothetical protein BGZ60DRAFT_544329 [Tricladium varicosporioides]|nr:hypothetical protein BGZ60DRAFT_544329 [Hymenoscyphus varicosporioides]
MASTPRKRACNPKKTAPKGIPCQYQRGSQKPVTSESFTYVEPTLQTVSKSAESIIDHRASSTLGSSRVKCTSDIILPQENKFQYQINMESNKMIDESRVCGGYASDILTGLSALEISVTNHHFSKLIDALGSNPAWRVEVEEDANLAAQFQSLELIQSDPFLSTVEYQCARDKYSVDLAGIGAQYL